MSHATLFALTIALAGSAGNDLDRQALTNLIDEIQRPVARDVSFEYEGKSYVTGDTEQASLKLAPGGLLDVFTGTFRRRFDGATSVDVYHFDKRTGRAKHGQVALLEGFSETSSMYAGEKQAKVKIKKQRPLIFAGPGNFRTIWLADWVRKLADSPYLYDFLGPRSNEGTECLVARFRLVLDETTPKDKQVSHIFWIDMNRGAHVVRHEERWGDNLVELTTVQLKRYETRSGHFAWLPTSGRKESRLALRGNETRFLDEPVAYESYFLLPLTLRFDQDLKDSAFSVKAKPGDVVSDELRKAKYEFGQYMVRPKAKAKVPTDAEVKANLDRMLKDSAVMAKELRASSPLRDGQGWSSHWPWAVAGLSALGVGFVYLRRRGA